MSTIDWILFIPIVLLAVLVCSFNILVFVLWFNSTIKEIKEMMEPKPVARAAIGPSTTATVPSYLEHAMTKRAIHLPQGTYTYKVGNKYIQIWRPNGTKILTDKAEVTGETWEYLTSCGYRVAIEPSRIRDFILAKEGTPKTI